jgi:hypothetical protein
MCTIVAKLLQNSSPLGGTLRILTKWLNLHTMESFILVAYDQSQLEDIVANG